MDPRYLAAESSYLSLLRDIRSRIEVSSATSKTSQEQIAFELESVRRSYAIDDESFGVILASLSVYEPENQRETTPDVLERLANHFETSQFFCQNIHPNTELLGVEAIDELRALIAGKRRGDAPFGIVFKRSGEGISSRPENRFRICGVNQKGVVDENGRTHSNSGAVFELITGDHWTELFPDRPYEEGNYFFRKGNHYAFWGPSFSHEDQSLCGSAWLNEAGQSPDPKDAGHPVSIDQLLPPALTQVMTYSRVTRRLPLTMVSRDQLELMYKNAGLSVRQEGSKLIADSPAEDIVSLKFDFDPSEAAYFSEMEMILTSDASVKYYPQQDALQINDGTPFPLFGDSISAGAGVEHTAEDRARLLVMEHLTGINLTMGR